MKHLQTTHTAGSLLCIEKNGLLHQIGSEAFHFYKRVTRALGSPYFIELDRPVNLSAQFAEPDIINFVGLTAEEHYELSLQGMFERSSSFRTRFDWVNQTEQGFYAAYSCRKL
ncbi:MAG: hypothetical protein AAF988_08945 [Pseudomonadota bacterium]